MKATVIKKQFVNGDDMVCLTFKLEAGSKMENYRFEQISSDGEDRTLNSGNERNGIGYINTIANACELEVGDSITDEKGGDPIFAAVTGKSEELWIDTAPLASAEQAFREKNGN